MRRRLRAELRRLRTDRGLTQSQVAHELEWSQSRIVRIEDGNAMIGLMDLQALLSVYDVDDRETVDSLTEMARGFRSRPVGEDMDVLPSPAPRFEAYESNTGPSRERGVLLALITLLLATIIGLISGILTYWAGANVPLAVVAGGGGFAGAVGVVIAILSLLDVKR